jgi:hypothetical protein
MKIGLGYRNDPQAFDSGHTLAAPALAQGTIDQSDLVLAET